LLSIIEPRHLPRIIRIKIAKINNHVQARANSIVNNFVQGSFVNADRTRLHNKKIRVTFHFVNKQFCLRRGVAAERNANVKVRRRFPTLILDADIKIGRKQLS